MKERIKHIIVASVIALTAGLATVSLPLATGALSPSKEALGGCVAAGGCADGQKSLGENITLVINILLFIIGAVAVIMVILGGIRYVLSNGDSTQISGAKNTILYAVIGIIVALLAYAIVNFVITQFTK